MKISLYFSFLQSPVNTLTQTNTSPYTSVWGPHASCGRSGALGFDTRTLNPSASIQCPKALKSCHSVCPSPSSKYSSTCDLRKTVLQLLELLLHPPRAAVSQD